MKKVIGKGKTLDKAIQNALEILNVSRDKVETRVLELPASGLIGLLGNRNAKVEVTVKIDYCETAKTFINDMLVSIGIFADITSSIVDKVLNVTIQGEDMGILIGRRGQTLDAIQYLTSLVINRETDEYIRVVVDTENYRAKREKTLIDLANKLANRVERTNRKLVLEPMNPYERRVIHSTLQKHHKIYTYSEGDDPYRKVVIDLK